MIIKEIEGDLLEHFKNNDKIVAIAHGCNCFHTMGAGVAGAIAVKFPSASHADYKSTAYGDAEKLGNFSSAKTKYGTVINGYTQYRPGRSPVNDLYQNIQKFFTQLNGLPMLLEDDVVLGIPRIGSGIANGDWQVIKKIIDDVTPDIKIIVYYI